MDRIPLYSVGAQRVQVDVVGLGAAVVDRLREVLNGLDFDLEVVEMGAGEKAHWLRSHRRFDPDP